jgi:hypothetical protein
MRIRDLVHVNKSFTEEMIDFTGFYEWYLNCYFIYKIHIYIFYHINH